MPAKRPSKRRSRPQRRRTRASPAPPSTPPEQPSHASPSATPFEGEIWNALRQGARNVAGVRYQLAVTALLLAQSRGGTLPFVELVPEGYEDIDCADRQSTHWLIQVKEFGAGAGTFTASSMADVIAHAALAPSTPARIVAITDGQLGTQLTASGWNRAVCRVEERRVAGRGSVALPALFAPGRNPTPMGTFPLPALRTRRADFRHRALQWNHAARTRASRSRRAVGYREPGHQARTLALAGRCVVRPVDALTTATVGSSPSLVHVMTSDIAARTSGY